MILSAVTAVLIGGWVAYTVLEWDRTLAGLPGWARTVTAPMTARLSIAAQWQVARLPLSRPGLRGDPLPFQ